MSVQPVPPVDRYAERDKSRPIIVHCLGLIVQAKTKCDDKTAIETGWDIFDYFGRPERLSEPQET